VIRCKTGNEPRKETSAARVEIWVARIVAVSVIGVA
jgi:hypothetical protein